MIERAITGIFTTVDRKLHLKGALNIRDVGGYETVNGSTVRWRRLLRGDNTDSLSRSDQRALRDYGLTTVVDLRDHDELSKWPSVFSDSDTQYISASLDVHSLLGEHLQEGNVLASWNTLLLEHRLPAIGNALRTIGESLVTGCTLVHCASGKDRTGLIVALILMAIGVSTSDIVADYALSAAYLSARTQRLREEAQTRGADLQAFDAEMGSDPRVMTETLRFVESSFGGIGGLLRASGLPADWLDLVRTGLLE